jgi:hypothetical protein
MMLHANEYNWTELSNLVQFDGFQDKLVEFVEALLENQNNEDADFISEDVNEFAFLMGYQIKYLGRDTVTALKNLSDITIFEAMDHHELKRKLEFCEDFETLYLLHKYEDDFDIYGDEWNPDRVVYQYEQLVEPRYLKKIM